VPAATDGTHSSRPGLALLIVVLGTVMVVLDTTIVTVALPAIGTALKASEGIEWVVTVYLLAVAASLPTTGWLADRLGRRATFLWSTAVFTVASLGCALSPSLGVLVACRALQGIGGGAIPTVGMAIVFEVFPRERHGRAISTWGLAALLAPAFGPTFGGWLVTAFSWHWLFLINLPIGLLAVVLGRRLLPELPSRTRRPLDVPSLLAGATGLSLVVLALANGNQWGWASPSVAGCGLGGLAVSAWFVHRNLHRRSPLLRLDLVKDRPFATAVAATFALHSVNYARLVFVPLELATVRHYSALRIGLLLAPAAIVTAICMKIGGRLVDRLGPRRPAMLGAVVMTAGTALLAFVRVGTPAWAIALALCLQAGFGLGAAGVAVAAMSDLPGALLAQAAALRNLVNQVAGALSVAGLSAILYATQGAGPSAADAQQGFTWVFAAAAGMGLVAVRLAARIDDTPPERDEEAFPVITAPLD
jgi:EmrB/QacA subfamily drug resistance transporter